MNPSHQNYENLIFEGGGVKGAAYAGCIQVLNQQNLYRQVKRVAGTSAGSITAGLLAVGAGSAGLTQSIIQSNFEDFIKDWGWIFGDIYRTLCHYGVHSGNAFVKILQQYINQYTNNPNLTFKQLEQLADEQPEKYKHLSVVSSNITTQQAEIFDSTSTPDLPIWKAIRCSMSIPVVFEPYEIDGNYYMDGGLSWVYPIDIYDHKQANGEVTRNPKTLGFYLQSPNQSDDPGFKPNKQNINSLGTAAMAMYNFMTNNANARHIHPDDKKRTVFIDDLGISTTDFDISLKDKHRLIEEGKIATEVFLNSPPTPPYPR